MKYTYKQFKAQHPDDDACLDAIMKRRYGTEPVCEGCGVVGTKFHRIAGRRAYACQWCGHHVYPCAGTIFEHSSTPLTLWFHAMYLMTSTRNGVSAKELERHSGVTYKCAFRIGHQLRDLMAARDKRNNPGQLKDHVEVDEAYIGGKKPGKRGRGAAGKSVVFGLLERGGDVRGKVVPDACRGTLRPIIKENVAPGTTISSDRISAISYFETSRLHTRHHRAQEGRVCKRDTSHKRDRRFLGALEKRDSKHAHLGIERITYKNTSMNFPSGTTLNTRRAKCFKECWRRLPRRIRLLLLPDWRGRLVQ